jgi:branched-chain amino acid aminotransferase
MSGPPAIWVNGTRHRSDVPHVSARDRGLTLGDGLFETMRAHRGSIFRLDRHLARIRRGLDVLSIPAPPDLREWVTTAVEADADVAVRLTITRGAGPAGVPVPPDLQPTVIVTVSPMPAFPPSTYEIGLRAQVASGRRNERSETAGLKMLSYGDAIVALLAAQRSGADEALFLDTEGHCSDASSSNLFVWTGDVLLTPPVSCAALPGITRATILDVATSLGLATAERPFGLDVLLSAREAFLTSSLRGVAPLVRIDESAIGDGRPGAVTRQIAFAYTTLLLHECNEALSTRA